MLYRNTLIRNIFTVTKQVKLPLSPIIPDMKFQLPQDFLSNYTPEVRKPLFGFNGLGEIAYLRSYARHIDSLGRQEMWHETVERVVNGCFNMQKEHCETNGIRWNH